MKQKLSFKEYIYVASMLFGMFFGAGNLIFPVYMGQVAGRNMWAAVLGFLITGVGLCWAWPLWASAAATAFLTSVIRWAVPMRSSLPALFI